MTEKLMSKTAHVVRRGAVYYFRLRVPADLLAHYGKNEIIFSLKTKDAAEAKLKAAAEGLRLQGEFTVLRQAMKANLVSGLTPEEIRRASLAFARSLILEDEQHRMAGNIPEAYEAGLDVMEEAAKNAAAGHDNHQMTRIVRGYLEDHGIMVEPESSLEKRLVYAFSQTGVDALEGIRLRDKGKAVPTPEPVSMATLRAKAGHLSHGDVLLSALIEQYCTEQEQAGNWLEKTSLDNRAIFRLFVDIVGDIPVSTIGYPTMRGYKEILLKLPPNLNKDKRYRGKSLAEVLAMPDVEPMSTTTINKHLIRVSSVSDWAVKHGYLDKNYAEGLTVAQRNKKVSEERSMFSPEHLEAIFKALAHGKVTRSGKACSFHYWMPLLGLFTGARVNELASLRPDDFVVEDGIPCLSISQQNDGTKETKSAAGVRVIPLHPELIRLGILEYVTEVKESNSPRLFPELRLTKNGYGDKVSKWFSGHNSREEGFLWRSGVAGTKLSFHSFRHTMTTQLERAGVEPVMIKRIMGHALDDVTFGRYSKGGTQAQYLEALQQAIPDTFTSKLPVFRDWINAS